MAARLPPVAARPGHALAAGIGVAATVSVLAAVFARERTDWARVFLPAVQRAFAGGDPYTGGGFFSPPWVLPLLAPFAALGDVAGGLALRACSLVLLLACVRRLGGGGGAAALVLTSFPVLSLLYYGNIEALALGGLLLPAAPAALVLAGKPQVGGGLLAVRLVKERSGWATLALAVVALGSLWLYPHWPAQALATAGLPWNKALWPLGMPLGIACLAAAWRRWPERSALALCLVAGPLLAPYVSPASWTGCMVGLARWPRLLFAAWAAYWVSKALAYFTGGWPSGW